MAKTYFIAHDNPDFDLFVTAKSVTSALRVWNEWVDEPTTDPQVFEVPTDISMSDTPRVLEWHKEIRKVR